MTDQIGIWEHARYLTRREEHGYCTDDNARALIVCCRQQDPDPGVDPVVRDLSQLHHRGSTGVRWVSQPAHRWRSLGGRCRVCGLPGPSPVGPGHCLPSRIEGRDERRQRRHVHPDGGALRFKRAPLQCLRHARGRRGLGPTTRPSRSPGPDGDRCRSDRHRSNEPAGPGPSPDWPTTMPGCPRR